MKVLFLKHVINIAKQGDVKNVSSGYATNFLFPKNLAKPFSKNLEIDLKNKEKKVEKDRLDLLSNKNKIINDLNLKKISFSLKTGANKKIYGGIGEKDIIKEIKKLFKISLGKKHIYMPSGHIKKLGEEFVYVKLGKDLMAKIVVLITSSDNS